MITTFEDAIREVAKGSKVEVVPKGTVAALANAEDRNADLLRNCNVLSELAESHKHVQLDLIARAEAAEAKLAKAREALHGMLNMHDSPISEEGSRNVAERARAVLKDAPAEPKPERHVLAHDRPGDGKQCVYLAIDVCNKCGWVRQYAHAEPKPEKCKHCGGKGWPEYPDKKCTTCGADAERREEPKHTPGDMCLDSKCVECERKSSDELVDENTALRERVKELEADRDGYKAAGEKAIYDLERKRLDANALLSRVVEATEFNHLPYATCAAVREHLGMNSVGA